MSVRHLEDIPADTDEAPDVAVRKIKRLEEVELKAIDLDPEGATPFHTHPHAHEGIVISGTGALRGEGSTLELAVGDVFSVAPDEPHAIENRGDETLRFVCLDCSVD